MLSFLAKQSSSGGAMGVADFTDDRIKEMEIRKYCNQTIFLGMHENVGIRNNNSVVDPEMVFSETNLMSIIVYSVLFIVSSLGNFTVFVVLFRSRRTRRSRVGLFIMHLTVADLFVTLVMMPLEIAWNSTVSWKAGDIACRMLMFCRAFGFYLSSFILIATSLDRYFAVSRPLSLQTADQRGRTMLIVAWILSAIASAPQSIIFHLERHPCFDDYTQCVTFNFFPTATHEIIYNLFNLVAVYLLPLVVIIITYSMILTVISKKVRQHKLSQIVTSRRNDYQLRRHSSEGLRSTGNAQIERAKTRTLKMTIVIVSAFIVCWTPYFVISAWWWFDQNSADKINPKVQKGLFLFAVSNSCVDPIVYGMFSTAFRCFRRSVNRQGGLHMTANSAVPQCHHSAL